MTFARTLPKRDQRYDAYTAKMSVLKILRARGYDLGKEVNMLDPEVGHREGYENFLVQLDELSRIETEKKTNALEEIRVNIPTDVTYVHPRGIISPLTVIFVATTSVNARLGAIMERLRSNPRRSAQVSHFLFVVDRPRDVTSSDAKLLGNHTLEILPYQRLLLNPLDHYRSPTRIEVLSSRRRDAMLSSPGIEGRMLPSILPIDPVALFLDMKPGDICRITDTRVYTGQNTAYIGYRRAPVAIVCSSEGCEEPSYTFRSHYCRECSMSS